MSPTVWYTQTEKKFEKKKDVRKSSISLSFHMKFRCSHVIISIIANWPRVSISIISKWISRVLNVPWQTSNISLIYSPYYRTHTLTHNHTLSTIEMLNVQRLFGCHREHHMLTSSGVNSIVCCCIFKLRLFRVCSVYFQFLNWYYSQSVDRFWQHGQRKKETRLRLLSMKKFDSYKKRSKQKEEEEEAKKHN